MSFIATLASPTSTSLGDSEDWEVDARPVQATPDGRFLVFQSTADLTPDQEGQQEAEQVFEYDAQTETLVRVSQGQEGYNDDGNSDVYAATIPRQEYEVDSPAIRFLHLAVSANGSDVFFSSDDALVARAVTGINNVYEYHEGQVALISDGHDASRVDGLPTTELVGTSESGHDVFFTTADSLVPQDTDTQVDVYDARVDGGFPSPATLAPCLGDTCQEPAERRAVAARARSGVLDGGTASVELRAESAVQDTAQEKAEETKSQHEEKQGKEARDCQAERQVMMLRPLAAGLRSHLGDVFRPLDNSSIILIVVMAMVGAVSPRIASAALPSPSGPAWEVSSVAQPTNFSAEDNATCSRPRLPLCDRYTITLTNIGNEPSDPLKGPVVIADSLPAGLKPRAPRALYGENIGTGEEFGCDSASLTCTYTEPVAPDGTLVIYVEVEVTSAANEAREATNVVTVSGGGAPPASTSAPRTKPNTIGAPASTFGIAALGITAHGEGGELESQAGDHPRSVTSTINLNTAVIPQPGGELIPASVEPPKDLVVYLPLGFVGDPTAAAQCTETQLGGPKPGDLDTECPAASRVGTLVVFSESVVTGTITPELKGGIVTAIYNMAPEAGFPAQFGFKFLGKTIPLYASLVHTSSGYAVRVGTPGIPITLNIEGVAVTFFNNPKAYFNEPSEDSPPSSPTPPTVAPAHCLRERKPTPGSTPTSGPPPNPPPTPPSPAAISSSSNPPPKCTPK